MVLEDLHERMTYSRQLYRKALDAHREATQEVHMLGADHPDSFRLLRLANSDLEKATHTYMSDLTAYTACLIREK